jgi:hypothetical protein
MPKKTKAAKKVPPVRVKDLNPKKNPKGGVRKSGEGQKEW